MTSLAGGQSGESPVDGQLDLVGRQDALLPKAASGVWRPFRAKAHCSLIRDMSSSGQRLSEAKFEHDGA